MYPVFVGEACRTDLRVGGFYLDPGIRRAADMLQPLAQRKRSVPCRQQSDACPLWPLFLAHFGIDQRQVGRVALDPRADDDNRVIGRFGTLGIASLREGRKGGKSRHKAIGAQASLRGVFEITDTLPFP